MLETLIVLVLLLWLVGAFIVPTGGSLVHLLLVIVILLILVRLIQGRPLP